jgi:hypothetical protein
MKNLKAYIAEVEQMIAEGKMKPMPKSHKAAMKNVVTFPDLNMSTGSAYLQYRFGIALAGSPDQPMPTDNYIGGDPMLTTYAQEEMDIIKNAAKQMGVDYDRNWSGPKSKELDKVNKSSVVAPRKKNKYGV